jgi:thiamine pyrophosphate-dependent acetolactate synthase large subunit-like protein
MQSHPAVLAELGVADLVLGIGVRAGTEVDRALRADFAGKLVVLDAADTSDTFPRVHASSVPSLAASLRELARLVGPRADAGAVRERCAEARRRLAGGIDVELERHAGARPWHIGLAVRALDQRMTPDLVVTSDVSNVKLWVPFQLRAFGPHSHVQAGSWGTMGYALPAAIGAAMACPGRKVVGLAGDASFLMSTSDLVTIAQHRLPIVLGVHHDGQIGMINYMQRMAGRAPYATEVGDVDYAKHAEAAGVRGIRVQEPDEIGPAWDAALAHHGPVLIEFMAGHDFPRPSVSRFVEQARD